MSGPSNRASVLALAAIGSTLYAVTQDVSDGFSLNEMIHFCWQEYETEPNSEIRLTTLLLGNLIVLLPSIAMAWMAYQNIRWRLNGGEAQYRIRSRASINLTEAHDHHHGIMHTLGHVPAYALIATLGFAASLDQQYAFAEFSGDDIRPWQYIIAICQGLIYSVFFMSIHQHHIEETMGDQRGVMGFLRGVYKTFVVNFSLAKFAILFAHLTEVYFILNSGLGLLARNETIHPYLCSDACATPLLDMCYLRLVFKLVIIVLSLLGLFEGNSEARCYDSTVTHDLGEQAPDYPNVFCWRVARRTVVKIALVLGILHASDHATGMAQLIRDIIIACVSCDTANYLLADEAPQMLMRAALWLLCAPIILPNALGFQAMLLEIYDRVQRRPMDRSHRASWIMNALPQESADNTEPTATGEVAQNPSKFFAGNASKSAPAATESEPLLANHNGSNGYQSIAPNGQ